MTPTGNEQRWNRPILFAAIWLSLSASVATAAPQTPTSGVSGTIRLIMNDQVVPLVGARVKVKNASDDRDEHEAMTDAAGHYAIDLPEGTYKLSFAWVDGGCSNERRAPFRLGRSEHLTFDFLTMHCVSIERARTETSSSLMNLPFAEQGRRYLEQLIPAKPDRWPEIIVSFGKYDNQVNEIRYLPMNQGVRVGQATAAPLLLSLPVIVTVDRYTLQAMEVVLNKKTMVFTAKGHVFISDGKSGKMGNYATLSFSNGQPSVTMKSWF
jgi:hypothetical protein